MTEFLQKKAETPKETAEQLEEVKALIRRLQLDKAELRSLGEVLSPRKVIVIKEDGSK